MCLGNCTLHPEPAGAVASEAPREAEAIKAAHPLRSGRHDLYAEAMRLVGERHAKGDLVELVNWLLVERIKP